jgi:hypothetical protein
MKTAAVLLLSASLVLPLAAQHDMPAPAKPATLMEGFGDLHHPVTTGNPQAAQFVDQELRLIYAFNHEAALLSFQRAAELDPKMAMAYRGHRRGHRAEFTTTR